MRRRYWIRLVAMAATVWATARAWSTAGASPVGAEVADLKEQLEDGLKVRLPKEFEFVANVVQLVEDNTLPLPLVKGTFQWARKKAGAKRYPFPSFERAMRIRAQKIGVTIP